jgi:hypothetical protein
MHKLKTKDGILLFENSDDFFKTINLIPKMTDEELDAWENKLGFTSVRTIQNEFYAKLESFDEKTITEKDIRNLVEQYKNYFEIVIEENGDEEIKEKIEDKSISAICNADMLVIKGENLTKYTNSSQISTKFENINKLMQSDNIEYYNEDKNFRIYIYKNENSKHGCGEDSEPQITEETTNPARRAWIQFTSGYDHSNFTNWAAYSKCRVWGQKKVLGIWYNYNGYLYLKNMQNVVNYWTNISGTMTNLNYTKTTPAKSDPDTKEITVTVNFPTFYSTLQPLDTYFIKYKGTFTSNGVGGIWQDSNCGY